MAEARQSSLFEASRPRSRNLEAEGRAAFIRAYRTVLNGSPRRHESPSFSFRFYPYSNLKNTLRVRSGVFRFRISDILSEAPAEVWEAAMGMLVARWSRRRTPPIYTAIYRDYVDQARVEERIDRVRRSRGSKKMAGPRGRIYDLAERFDRLNRQYFNGDLEVRRLGWSLRGGRRSLGHYDSTHDTIVLNRALDKPRVPGYVVDFVLYHEMLHAWMGIGKRGRPRRIHPPEFRRAERHFEHFEKADRFIKKKWGSLRD